MIHNILLALVATVATVMLTLGVMIVGSVVDDLPSGRRANKAGVVGIALGGCIFLTGVLVGGTWV